MSELRQDILTKEWIFFATDRDKRPYDFSKKSVEKDDTKSTCPFCPGNEKALTDIMYEKVSNGIWKVRAFANKYPAVSYDEKEIKESSFYNNVKGVGLHEVIVDTPNHGEQFCNFSDEHIFDVLYGIQQRFKEISSKNDLKYVQIFKNNGPEAGMSLIHSHWQIIGIPVIPMKLETSFLSCEKYFKENDRCLICDIVKNEKEEKVRFVYENDNFVAFTPYAAKLSYEIWIVPKKHISSYADFDNDELHSFGNIFKNILLRVNKITENVSYNVCFIDMPKNQNKKYFHWYAKIYPRLGNFAGFEFATGSFINPVMPENSAKFYRENI